MARKPKKPKQVIDPDSLPYEVGKWKTDPNTRFKKGQSGNPSGKSKRPKPKEPTLSELGDMIVSIPQKDGSVVEMSNRLIINKQIIAMARKGSIPHIRIWLENERSVAAGEGEIDPLIFDPGIASGLLETFKAEQRERFAADKAADDGGSNER